MALKVYIECDADPCPSHAPFAQLGADEVCQALDDSGEVCLDTLFKPLPSGWKLDVLGNRAFCPDHADFA
jgi:hypothetical protein